MSQQLTLEMVSSQIADLGCARPIISSLDRVRRSMFSTSCAKRSLNVCRRHAQMLPKGVLNYWENAIEEIWEILNPASIASAKNIDLFQKYKSHIPSAECLKNQEGEILQCAAIAIAYTAKTVAETDIQWVVNVMSYSRDAVENEVYLNLLPRGRFFCKVLTRPMY